MLKFLKLKKIVSVHNNMMIKVLSMMLIGTFMLSSVALGANGDLWKNGVNQGGIASFILGHKTKLFDLIRNINSYSYEVNGKLYKTKEVNDRFISNPDFTPEEATSTLTPVADVTTGQAITTISSIDNITVVMSQNDSYIPPQTVSAKMSDGSTKDVIIVWSDAAKAFKADTAGQFTFYGTVDGYSGQVSLVITVLAKVTIASIDSITANVGQNDSYTLPQAVSAKMSDGSTKDVTVVWSDAAKAFKADTAGQFTFDGTVDGYSGQISLVITVQAKATIASINSITDSVYQNDSYTLPQTVSAKMSDGSSKNVTVVWSDAAKAFKADTAGRFTFYGTVDGYAGQVTLIITVQQAASTNGPLTYLILDPNHELADLQEYNVNLVYKTTYADGYYYKYSSYGKTISYRNGAWEIIINDIDWNSANMGYVTIATSKYIMLHRFTSSEANSTTTLIPDSSYISPQTNIAMNYGDSLTLSYYDESGVDFNLGTLYYNGGELPLVPSGKYGEVLNYTEDNNEYALATDKVNLSNQNRMATFDKNNVFKLGKINVNNPILTLQGVSAGFGNIGSTYLLFDTNTNKNMYLTNYPNVNLNADMIVNENETTWDYSYYLNQNGKNGNDMNIGTNIKIVGNTNPVKAGQKLTLSDICTLQDEYANSISYISGYQTKTNLLAPLDVAVDYYENNVLKTIKLDSIQGDITLPSTPGTYTMTLRVLNGVFKIPGLSFDVKVN